jgi:hypothetical protein
VPEIVEEGVTGHIVDSVQEAVSRIDSLLALDRKRIRHSFEQRFTAHRMTRDYVDIYRRLMSKRFVESGNLRPMRTDSA